MQQALLNNLPMRRDKPPLRACRRVLVVLGLAMGRLGINAHAILRKAALQQPPRRLQCHGMSNHVMWCDTRHAHAHV